MGTQHEDETGQARAKKQRYRVDFGDGPSFESIEDISARIETDLAYSLNWALTPIDDSVVVDGNFVKVSRAFKYGSLIVVVTWSNTAFGEWSGSVKRQRRRYKWLHKAQLAALIANVQRCDVARLWEPTRILNDLGMPWQTAPAVVYVNAGTASTTFLDGANYSYSDGRCYSHEELKQIAKIPALAGMIPLSWRARIQRELNEEGWRKTPTSKVSFHLVAKSTRHHHRTDPRWSNNRWRCKTKGQPLSRPPLRKKSLLKA